MNQALPPSILNAPEDRYSTHQVLNQALPASGFNAFTGDQVFN